MKKFFHLIAPPKNLMKMYDKEGAQNGFSSDFVRLLKLCFIVFLLKVLLKIKWINSLYLFWSNYNTLLIQNIVCFFHTCFCISSVLYSTCVHMHGIIEIIIVFIVSYKKYTVQLSVI